MSTWFVTLLSATLVNVAFFYPDYLGFLIIPGVVLLAYLLTKKHLKNAWIKATSYGLLIFTPHFIWLYALLNNRTNASNSLAFILYGIVVLYFTGTFVVWFCVTRWILNIINVKKCSSTSLLISSSLSLVVYYLFIAYLSLSPFTGHKEGYPFLNPCIPLAQIMVRDGATHLLTTNDLERTAHPEEPARRLEGFIHYLKPIKSFDHPTIDGQRIFHYLTQQRFKESDIIVAPESFFTFPINQYPSLITLWACTLPQNAFFIFGTQWLEHGQLYQVICGLHQGTIQFVYRKQHLISFVEHMPHFLKQTSWLRSLFLHEVQEFHKASNQNALIVLNNQQIMLQLCSEFFFTKVKTDQHSINMIFFLINDSWFVDYFRKIIENLACIKSIWLNTPVLYVGHNHCKLISRKGLHERLYVKRC